MRKPPKLKKQGKIYSFYKNGTLKCKQSKSNIKKKWLKPLKQLVNAFIKEFKEEIHSIYVKGSVAEGTCLDNYSDIDLFICLHENKLHNKWEKKIQQFHREYRKQIPLLFPFITHVDLMIASENEHHPDFGFIIKHRSICLYGEDLSKNIKKYTKQDIKGIYSGSLEYTLSSLFKRKVFTNTMCKVVVRCGFYLVYDDVNVWTKALYPCYKMFSDKYPQYKNIMKSILIGAITQKYHENDIKVSYDELCKFINWLNTEIIHLNEISNNTIKWK
tara:strand:+ start:710 stop:1528 length:819 start_codon:yes stop_codon:yes gene_type:complete